MAESCTDDTFLAKLDASFDELEKKYVAAAQKLLSNKVSEGVSQCVKVPDAAISKRMPRVTNPAKECDTESTEELYKAKERVYTLQAENKALEISDALAKERLHALRERKARGKKELETMRGKMEASWNNLTATREAIVQATPMVEKIESNQAKFQPGLDKCDQAIEKNRLSKQKLTFHRNKSKAMRKVVKGLERKITDQTKRAEEVKEQCHKLRSDEKIAIDKLEECYEKIRKDEEKMFAETNPGYEEKWSKTNKYLKCCDSLIEITKSEIKDLQLD